MECDKCGEKTFVIFITKDHKKLCDNCWGKLPQKNEWEIIQEKNEKYKRNS